MNSQDRKALGEKVETLIRTNIIVASVWLLFRSQLNILQLNYLLKKFHLTPTSFLEKKGRNASWALEVACSGEIDKAREWGHARQPALWILDGFIEQLEKSPHQKLVATLIKTKENSSNFPKRNSPDYCRGY